MEIERKELELLENEFNVQQKHMHHHDKNDESKIVEKLFEKGI